MQISKKPVQSKDETNSVLLEKKIKANNPWYLAEKSFNR